jgi:hypothetical protein
MIRPFAAIAIVMASTVVHAETVAGHEKPNILFIMSDDMNDGCCCNEEIARENHCFSSSSERN